MCSAIGTRYVRAWGWRITPNGGLKFELVANLHRKNGAGFCLLAISQLDGPSAGRRIL
jgi:hypothetical protein